MRRILLGVLIAALSGSSASASSLTPQVTPQQYNDAMASAAAPVQSIVGMQRVLGSIRGANLNITTDQALAVASGVTKYTVTQVITTNCSTTPTLAAGGVYTAASKGGSAIVAAGQVYTALSSASTMLPLTLAITTSTFTAVTLYFSLTTANGGALTCDVYVVGTDLT